VYDAFPIKKCSQNQPRSEGARLPKVVQLDNVKYMSRLIFAALGCLIMARAVAAQHVPGRDLLEFPLGLLAEAAPLSTQMAGGFWNPASGALTTRRAAFGLAGLTTPQDQGVRLDLLGGAVRMPRGYTAVFSLASASVSDILRTETDPQSKGGEIPYSTTVISAGVARATSVATFGLSARYRRGTSDAERAGAFGLDGGVVVDRLWRVPVRVALSTFLFTPSSDFREATYSAAADIPVYQRDSSLAFRLGQAVSRTEGRGRDHYSFATARYGQLGLSSGVLRSFAYGNSTNRWRLGCGLDYAAYTIAIAREDGAAGLGASYQFLFKRVIR
jgi:hypothetical protein